MLRRLRRAWFVVCGRIAYRRLLLVERRPDEPIGDVASIVPVTHGLLREAEIDRRIEMTRANAAGARSENLDAPGRAGGTKEPIGSRDRARLELFDTQRSRELRPGEAPEVGRA
jgi:hypothetical protein